MWAVAFFAAMGISIIASFMTITFIKARFRFDPSFLVFLPSLIGGCISALNFVAIESALEGHLDGSGALALTFIGSLLGPIVEIGLFVLGCYLIWQFFVLVGKAGDVAAEVGRRHRDEAGLPPVVHAEAAADTPQDPPQNPNRNPIV
jgi:hypothetical protein